MATSKVQRALLAAILGVLPLLALLLPIPQALPAVGGMVGLLVCGPNYLPLLAAIRLCGMPSHRSIKDIT